MGRANDGDGRDPTTRSRGGPRGSGLRLYGGALILALLATSAWPAIGSDQDGDGFPDVSDNCVFITNPDQVDGDGDLVGDACDECRTSPSDVPDGLDSMRLATDEKGCTVTERCPCPGPGARTWRHRREYIRCIRRQSGRLRRFHRLTPNEQHAMVRVARASTCGFARGRPGDMDGDGIPDDGDDSGVVGDHLCPDGVTAQCDDNCLRSWNPKQKNRGGKADGDACDSDIDGDGINNRADNCPRKKNEDQHDGDGDGVGDLCDACPGTDPDVSVDYKGCD